MENSHFNTAITIQNILYGAEKGPYLKQILITQLMIASMAPGRGARHSAHFLRRTDIGA